MGLCEMGDCCRVKRISKMSEKVATGVLSGVVKVSGFFTSAVVNSKVGKKFFSILPGEIILASLDGFGMYGFRFYLYSFILFLLLLTRN